MLFKSHPSRSSGTSRITEHFCARYLLRQKHLRTVQPHGTLLHCGKASGLDERKSSICTPRGPGMRAQRDAFEMDLTAGSARSGFLDS